MLCGVHTYLFASTAEHGGHGGREGEVVPPDPLPCVPHREAGLDGV